MNYVCFGYHLVNKQWGNYGDSSNTLITLNLNITSSKILFAIATDITNNGNPQGAYLGYDVIENNKIRFLFDATPWTFAWFCISKQTVGNVQHKYRYECQFDW